MNDMIERELKIATDFLSEIHENNNEVSAVNLLMECRAAIRNLELYDVYETFRDVVLDGEPGAELSDGDFAPALVGGK